MRRSRLAAAVLAAAAAAAPAPLSAESAPGGWCATASKSARALLLAHREQAARRGFVRTASAAATRDVGEIAVLEDEGDLALLANPLDLRSIGLALTPAGGGFRVVRADSAVGPDAGAPLSLGDDDSLPARLPFTFPFYGRGYADVFVNSDGNLTFGAGDAASTARDLARLAGGPPRIAALLADLNPTAGGSVSVRSESGRFTVTWTDVPRYGQQDRNTFRVSLSPDGTIELAYGDRLATALVGVAGVAPGAGSAALTGVDLSEAAGEEGRALAEAFRPEDELDVVATARRFLATHPDDFQQLVVFTTQRLTEPGTLAFETTVRNEVAGIGVGRYDLGAEYGSPGALESFVMMDDVAMYPADPGAVVFAPDSTLSLLAHETGHRWLARVAFMDGATRSDELLGRQSAHWSFFTNSLGSHLEGNEIEDLGAGRFVTVAASVRYSPLDQYLMGIRAPEEVPGFFHVTQVSGTGLTDRGTKPQVGVSFQGRRNDVTVADVIAAEGARDPASGPVPEAWRQAFVLVAVGSPPDAEEIAVVERIRQAWPGFFAESVEHRWSVRTELP